MEMIVKCPTNFDKGYFFSIFLAIGTETFAAIRVLFPYNCGFQYSVTRGFIQFIGSDFGTSVIKSVTFTFQFKARFAFT